MNPQFFGTDYADSSRRKGKIFYIRSSGFKGKKIFLIFQESLILNFPGDGIYGSHGASEGTRVGGRDGSRGKKYLFYAETISCSKN